MDRRGWWLTLCGMSALVIVLDLVTGPYVQFPITFVAPVGLAAWHLGRRPGLAFAVILVGARLAVALWWEPVNPPWTVGVNAAIRLAILGGEAVLLDLVARQRRALAGRVEMLEGILPICAGCKRIRQDDGSWQPIEIYVSDRSQARFSHGICRDCAQRLYGMQLDGLPSSRPDTQEARPASGRAPAAIRTSPDAPA